MTAFGPGRSAETSAVAISPPRCEGCGSPMPPYRGHGGPRRFCLACSPTDPLACTQAWRARNRDDLLARRRAARALAAQRR